MNATAPLAADDKASGAALYRLAQRLYPICRSITGEGVRQTLELIGARLPLKVHEVRSGTRAFDWQIPPEWNVEDAAVLDPDGRRVVDFRRTTCIWSGIRAGADDHDTR
jgi:aminopeptidase-like protein